MKSRFSRLAASVGGLLQQLRLQRWTALAVAGGFLVALAVVLVTTQAPSFALHGTSASWQSGTVADMDFVIERDFQYVDDPATQLKKDAQEKLVPPVFMLNPLVTASVLDTFDRFSQALGRLAKQGLTETSMLSRLRVDFPDHVSRAMLHSLLDSRDLGQALGDARALLEGVLAGGIIDLGVHSEDAVRAGTVELRQTVEGRLQSEEMPLDQATTLQNVTALVETRSLRNPTGRRRDAPFSSSCVLSPRKTHSTTRRAPRCAGCGRAPMFSP